MVVTEPHAKMAIIYDMMYPPSWLAEKALNDPEGRTNKELLQEVTSYRQTQIFISTHIRLHHRIISVASN